MLILREFNPDVEMYTGNKIARTISKIYYGLPGLKSGYVVMQITEPTTNPFYHEIKSIT